MASQRLARRPGLRTSPPTASNRGQRGNAGPPSTGAPCGYRCQPSDRPDKAAIEDALTVVALTEQAEAIERVPADFAAVAAAYRTWAVGHPHLHRLLDDRPLNRPQLPPGLEDRAAAPLVAASGGDRDLARAAWATMKCLVDLELADRFPLGADLAAAYAAAARAYGGAGITP